MHGDHVITGQITMTAYMAAEYLMRGYGGDCLSPDLTTKRAMLVKLFQQQRQSSDNQSFFLKGFLNMSTVKS